MNVLCAAHFQRLTNPMASFCSCAFSVCRSLIVGSTNTSFEGVTIFCFPRQLGNLFAHTHTHTHVKTPGVCTTIPFSLCSLSLCVLCLMMKLPEVCCVSSKSPLLWRRRQKIKAGSQQRSFTALGPQRRPSPWSRAPRRRGPAPARIPRTGARPRPPAS